MEPCPRCGQQVEEYVTVCGHCGRRLPWALSSFSTREHSIDDENLLQRFALILWIGLALIALTRFYGA